MFFRKKKPAPPITLEPEERLVLVDLWYVSEDYPGILQSWTWQTVDLFPDFPKALAWIDAMAENVSVHHWQITESRLEVPRYNPGEVHPITSATH